MYLVPNIHPGSGSAGVPTVQANFAGSPADWTTLDSTSTMPTGGSISRAGNAMLYDSTGKLTYAPNNVVLQSQALATSPWSNYAQGTGVNPVVTNNAGVAPDNTNTATRVELDCGAGGTSSDRSVRLQGSITLVTGTSYIISVYVKAYDAGNVGKTIRVSADGLGNLPIVTLTSSWQRVHLLATATGTGGIFNIETRGTITTQTADVLVWGAQLEAVTYQTTPSTYNATTTSAYYGPRFDYDPVTLQPKGLLVEGTRSNLLTYNSTFSNAIWAKGGATITSNSTTAPDGTVAASTLVEDTTTAPHYVYYGAALSSNTHSFSVYIKAAGRTWAKIALGQGTQGTAYYDLSNGAVGTVTSGYAATIASIGNGWYRCSLSGLAAGSVYSAVIYSATANGTDTYAGNGTSGIYVWGSQLEQAAFPSSYMGNTTTGSPPITRAAETFSLTGYANRLVEAYYIDEETGANYSGNSALSTGTVTISPPTFGWVTSLRAYTNAYAGSISSPSWLSFSRAGNAMYYDSTGTLTWAPSNMLLNSATLSTQTVTVTSGATNLLSFSGTGSITYSGAASGTLTGTGANNRVSVVLTMSTTSLTLTVSGTVTNAQLERVTYQTAPSAYIPTTSAAVYGPRYDYDPSTVPATPRGLLIEESRSNIVTYSEQINDASWGKQGVSVTANATTSPDGTVTADLVIPSVTPNTQTFYKTGLASGVYTASIYAKAGGVNTFVLYLNVASNGATFNLSTGTYTITGSATATITYVGNGWYRCSVYSTTAGTDYRVYTPSASSTASGDGVSGVYFWGAQLEAGSFATSYIPTTSASVTRAADVAQLTGSALTTLQGTQATLIAEAISASTTAKYLISARKTASGNYGDFYSLLSTYSTIYAGSSEQASMGYIPLPTTTSIFRAAFAIQSNNFAAVANNGTVQTDTSGSVVTGIDQGWLGGYSDGVYLNGYVRSLALYNQRLPNAILKQKSTVNAPY